MSDRLQLSHTPMKLFFPGISIFTTRWQHRAKLPTPPPGFAQRSGDVRCQQDANFHYCSQSAFGQRLLERWRRWGTEEWKLDALLLLNTADPHFARTHTAPGVEVNRSALESEPAVWGRMVTLRVCALLFSVTLGLLISFKLKSQR